MVQWAIMSAMTQHEIFIQHRVVLYNKTLHIVPHSLGSCPFASKKHEIVMITFKLINLEMPN